MRNAFYCFLLSAFLVSHGMGQRQVFFGHNQLHSQVVGSHVTLLWVQSPGSITGNNVYRGTQMGGPYTNIFSSGAPITTYVDNGCVGTCFYVVTAVSSAGETAYSNEASASVP